MVVVGKKNDLYKNDVIDLEKLQGQDFIGREEGSNDRNQLEQFLINKGIKLNKVNIVTEINEEDYQYRPDMIKELELFEQLKNNN